jgi:hypothetical protein
VVAVAATVAVATVAAAVVAATVVVATVAVTKRVPSCKGASGLYVKVLAIKAIVEGAAGMHSIAHA